MNAATHSESAMFATTRWTEVLAARGDSAEARQALAELCSAYYAPVLTYLRHTGVGSDDPRDVAHEFFAGLLARDALAGVERDGGRFRSYLLGALKHFLSNRRLHAGRLRRGGGAEHQSLDAASDADPQPLPGFDEPPRDAAFDHEWAVTLVEGALGRLEAEVRADGHGASFEVLKPWLSFDAEPQSQAAAAARLHMSEGAVKVAIHRLRRRFRELVRLEVGHTVRPGESVDAELRHLVEALGRTPPA